MLFFQMKQLLMVQDSYTKFQLEADFFIVVTKPWGKQLIMSVLTDC